MLTLMLMGAMALYTALAVVIYKLVAKATKSRACKIGVAAFLILFPTWDVMLGVIVYIPMSYVWPKKEIYRMAKTDGIYYDAENVALYDRTKWQNPPKPSMVKKAGPFVIYHGEAAFVEGFRYVENKVMGIYDSKSKSVNKFDAPKVYRCTLTDYLNLTRNVLRKNMVCDNVPKPISRYRVDYSWWNIGSAGFTTQYVEDMQSKEILGEYNSITLYTYSGFMWVPFFNWTKWQKWLIAPGNGRGIIAKKPKGKFFNFELNILKPVKQ